MTFMGRGVLGSAQILLFDPYSGSRKVNLIDKKIEVGFLIDTRN